MNSDSKSLPWDEVEKQIFNEIKWLRNTIETFSEEEKFAPIACKECLLRRIAVLIVSGKIKATQIIKDSKLESFWLNGNNANKIKIYHGSDWHRNAMERIENHFIKQGFKVEREPSLHWGRADLGVYKKGKKNLYIEIGTTSFFKLWINLKEMRKFILLVVPHDNYLLEFISEK